jgi:uncharacterized protein (TIGR02646 family)
MKHIVKQQEPQKFSEWKAMANENWQPTYNDLSGAIKQSVKQALMAEQGYLCCYCERRLMDDDSHIEHFRPQCDPQVDPLDYANLLCSCQNRIEKGDPRHCGNLKNGWFDEALLVSPLSDDCAERFAYTGDGKIHPANSGDDSARKTIERLGLGIPKVNALREMAIEPFLDDYLSELEMKQFVSGYLQRDGQGRFGEFWTSIHYLFKAYATQ